MAMKVRASFGPALLALAAIVALLLPAAAAAERTVAVEATATVKVPNDSASFGLGVSLTRGSRGAALRATSAKLQQVIATVQAIPGVGDGDVKTGRVSVDKVGRGQYRASQGIGVTLHEPAKAGDLVQAAIAAGATGVRGPSYFVGDTEAAYATALGAAFAEAKAKATTLATQAGATLGQALQINEGGNTEIVPYQDKAAAPEAGSCGVGATPAAPTTAKRAANSNRQCVAVPPPTKPGVSTVTATVGVVFELR